MQDKATLKFIAKAVKLRGEKFDYSRVNYINNTTEVLIGCPDHGFLWSMPSTHLRKRTHGCKKCGLDFQAKNSLNKRSAEFFVNCKKVHGNKFDYTDTVFRSGSDEITFFCPEHGTQRIQAKFHLGKHGCRECANDQKRNQIQAQAEKRKSVARLEFVGKANLKHNNYYDYSEVKYINNSTPIIISCPKHGAFNQTPANHLAGNGCTTCAIKTRGEKRKWSKRQFLDAAIAIHGQLYNYSKFKYVCYHTASTIMCAKSNHQPFQQSPAKHLAGHGCHACAEEARDAHRRTSGHNTKSWISKAKEVHGDRYDYSCTVYDGHHEKVKIGCEFHGFFELEHAYQHIETERRRGCPECALRDSKHSIAIERWLIESNYNFIKEWSGNPPEKWLC